MAWHSKMYVCTAWHCKMYVCTAWHSKMYVRRGILRRMYGVTLISRLKFFRSWLHKNCPLSLPFKRASLHIAECSKCPVQERLLAHNIVVVIMASIVLWFLEDIVNGLYHTM